MVLGVRGGGALFYKELKMILESGLPKRHLCECLWHATYHDYKRRNRNFKRENEKILPKAEVC